LCLVYQLLVVRPRLYTFSFCRMLTVVGVGWVAIGGLSLAPAMS